MEYHKAIHGRLVIVTTNKPFVFDPARNKYVEPTGVAAAFRFDSEPKLTTGEYVKENGSPKFFKTDEEARDAAFELAEQRLQGAK